MYIPEGAIDDKIVVVEADYSGSSRDHYYRSNGTTEEASRLLRRERACGCRPCLQLKDGCILTPANTDTKAGKSPRATTMTLQSSMPAPAARHTRGARNPLPEFCKGLKLGQYIVIRVSNEKKDDCPDENYVVAKVEEKSIKLEEGGTYSAVLYSTKHVNRKWTSGL